MCFSRPIIPALLATIAMMSLSMETAAGNYWDWADMSDEQEAFCDTTMPPFLEIRDLQGDEAALRELDRLFELAAEQFGSSSFFSRVVWYEAQVHSGKQDEAWGVTLYEYLWNRKLTAQPNLAENLPANDFILLKNIVESCYSLGQAAKARSYAMIIEDNLTRNPGFDITRERYGDLGPIFSFLPEARMRAYPVFRHELTEQETPEDRERRDFIYYPYIYALNDVAESAQKSGDWVTAAEFSIWAARYCDEYLLDQSNMKEEICDVTSYAGRKQLSEIALLHGYPEEAARFLEDHIERALEYEWMLQKYLYKAQLELAVIRIMTGELTEDALALADRAVEQSDNDLYTTRTDALRAHLNQARIYHALGFGERAWEMLDELLDQTARDVNPHHWVFMLTTAIDLALEDGAVRPELEGWLQLALENARQAANKFEELPLYEKYARFLVLKGRLTEAVQVQQEAVRLAGAINLPKRKEDNLQLLAEMSQLAEEQAVTQVKQQPIEGTAIDAPVVSTASLPSSETEPGEQETSSPAIVISSDRTAPAVDIQPRLSASAALPGNPALGRFYLVNPTPSVQSGRLCLSGPVDDGIWLDTQWVTVGASPLYAESGLVRELHLGAGEYCIVDVTGLPGESGQGAEIVCEWIPDEASTSSVAASWTFEAAETEKRTAVIDAHEWYDSPFFLIPIRHTLQRRHADGPQIVDYAIEASSPTRIEAYAADTGYLLSVDANGDGDYLDQGDLVTGDHNRNNLPDLTFDAGESMTSIILYVKPCEPVDTELSILLLQDGAWRTDAVDVIKAR